MTIEIDVALLALKLTPGLGNVSVNRVAEWVRGSGRDWAGLLGAPERDLLTALPAGMHREAAAVASCTDGTVTRARSLIDRVHEAGGTTIVAGAGDYPVALAAALGRNAPPLLCMLGDPDLLARPGVAVVGTRSPSDTGSEVARETSRVLAEQDIAVISGAAQGIDLAAHEAAIDANGRTVVVLPEGLLGYHGPEFLVRAAADGRALLVSEFSPDARWSTHGALARNATIAALASVLCVFEPGETGGSAHVARTALDLGKSVFIWRGAAHASDLLDQGATPLPDDLGERVDALLGAMESSPKPELRPGELF